MKIFLERKDFPNLKNTAVASTGEDPRTALLTISTPHDDPDERMKPTIEGDFASDLESALNDSFGYYGHRIDIASTTNLDLLAACQNLENYTFLSSEPKKIIPSPLPEGTQS